MNDSSSEVEYLDPSLKRELPNRMKFIEEKRTNMTSVRIPSDYPYKKRFWYPD